MALVVQNNTHIHACMYVRQRYQSLSHHAHMMRGQCHSLSLSLSLSASTSSSPTEMMKRLRRREEVARRPARE